MKIKTKELDYSKVMELPRPEHKFPKKQNPLFSFFLRAFSEFELREVDFKYTKKNMEAAGDGPWLVLMNHCSFLDIKIVSKIMYPKPYSIVSTDDGFVGREWMMRNAGCIPTKKFIADIGLFSDISYAINKNKSSVVIYPEASYSFDGTTTKFQKGIGLILKRLGVPVVMITTEGSFTRDPLYNNLLKRDVKVKATVECLFSKEDLKNVSLEQIDEALEKAFDLDYFKWQKDNKVVTKEPFRADCLNRILYKCCECGTEGMMEGKGTTIKCKKCGKEYEMDEYGCLHAKDGNTRFSHIPDWYAWERNEVRKAIDDGSYLLKVDVDIAVMVDHNSIYKVGNGVLKHDVNGFVLDGCEGKLHYEQKADTSYSLYSDYYWYEIGDVICIGNTDCLYYCFPKQGDVVAKTRMAVEEIYKKSHYKK